MKWGFTITLPLLLLAYIILKKWRPFTRQWLLSSYIIAFAYCTWVLIDRLIDLFEALKLVPKKTEDYNFYYSNLQNPGIYVHIILLVFIITLFFFRRTRHSFWWGLLVLLILHYEYVYITITSLYRDYLPSSWGLYYRTPFNINIQLFGFVVFNLLVAVVYFVRKLWQKKWQLRRK
jgi:molybdopterin-containing oxidoreductase family membrane subunit